MRGKSCKLHKIRNFDTAESGSTVGTMVRGSYLLRLCSLAPAQLRQFQNQRGSPIKAPAPLKLSILVGFEWGPVGGVKPDKVTACDVELGGRN